MHKLTIEDDEGKTVVVPLIRDEITVGRQEGNSIRLTERNISRRHARFFRQNNVLFVEDVGSYNGIKVNGSRITAKTELKDADLVVVGDYKLTVRADKPVATRLYGGGAAPFTTGAGPAAPPTAGPQVTVPPAATTAMPAPMRTVPLPTQAPAPDAALDAAPTIPVRTLAEQGMTADAPPPARLVVTTTNLAGSEFPLNRPSLVIGRTPENDVVLNHKSISRHHAKIIRDGDKYIVVDLESANGVRVNGTEFERVELQAGDTLELGHVKLKFAAGSEYVDFEMGGGGSKRKLIIGGAVGAVALAGLVLAFASGGNDGEKKAATPVPVVTAAPNPVPPPPPVEPATPAPATPPASIETMIADAKAAMERQSWAVAMDAVKRALDVQPSAPEALALKSTIESEQQSAERFESLKQASAKKDYEGVITLFGAIPDSSSYKSRALPIKQSAQNRFIGQRMADAERLQARGQCDDARKEVDRVLALEPQHAAAKSVIERCDKLATRQAERQKEAAVARETPPPAPREAPPPREPRESPPPRPVVSHANEGRTSEPRPTSSRPAPPPAGEGGDPDALLQEAQQAWLRGQYAAAIEASRKALRSRPNFTRAYQIIAVCSCSLRDADGAAKAYERLEDRMKPLVKSACQKSGIALN